MGAHVQSRIRQSVRILRGGPNFFSGLTSLYRVISQVWWFDLTRKGIVTGFQARPEYSDDKESMWYSPGETYTLRKIIEFSGSWIDSYVKLSSECFVSVFVDLGMGAGKPQLIASESQKFDLCLGVELETSLVELANSNFSNSSKTGKNGGGGSI